GSVGLTIANAQQAQAPAFIAGDRPVTAEQVLEKLQTDGWSNVAISRSGRYIEVTGSRNGEVGKMAVDSQTGRLRADNDDDADAAAMRSHDFADDGKAEAGALLLFPRAAPKPLEDALSILPRHAAAAIGHVDPAGTIDRHGHFRSSRRVSDRVLDQISQRIFERVNVCFDVHWPLGSG